MSAQSTSIHNMHRPLEMAKMAMMRNTSVYVATFIVRRHQWVGSVSTADKSLQPQIFYKQVEGLGRLALYLDNE
jgi:hypothetical protein